MKSNEYYTTILVGWIPLLQSTSRQGNKLWEAAMGGLRKESPMMMVAHLVPGGD
jgi:hypothetical protein